MNPSLADRYLVIPQLFDIETESYGDLEAAERRALAIFNCPAKPHRVLIVNVVEELRHTKWIEEGEKNV